MRRFISKYRHLFYLFRHSRLDAWVLRGRELTTGSPLSIAYIGTAPLKNYYAHLAFAKGFTEKSLGRCWPVFFRFWVGLFFRDCGLVVYEILQEYEPLTGPFRWTLKNPSWVRLEMNVSGSLEACMRKHRYKSITKQIEKMGFTYEIRTDDEAFEEFYHKMYLPSVESRYGDTGMVIGYNSLKKKYKNGELLMVKLGEDRIGGSLVDFSQEKPRFITMGVLGGDDKYLKMGVGSAIYYFEFVRLLELGGKVADLGSSRGFLRDRPLMFKISVGAYMAESHVREAGFLYLKVRHITPGLKAFLINNPFFILDEGGKCWAAIFVDSIRSVPESARDQIREFAQAFVSPRIYSFDPPEILRENKAAVETSLANCPVESAHSALK